MKIYESDYKIVHYDEGVSLMHIDWTPETINLNDETYRREASLLLDMVKKYRPKYFISDTRKFNFLITPETQEWLAVNILSQLSDYGIEKFAACTSEDMVAQLSIEQTFKETENTKMGYRTGYFANTEDARKWLLEED